MGVQWWNPLFVLNEHRGKRTKAATLQRNAIKAFTHSGATSHSGHASSLGYVVEHCERNNIPYKITAYPGKGYVCERMKEMEG